MNCCDGQMSEWYYLAAILILGALLAIIRLRRGLLVRSTGKEATTVDPGSDRG